MTEKLAGKPMLKILLLFLLATLSLGCLSVRVPLNVPPKQYTFENEPHKKEAGSPSDSVKHSILLPSIMFGGLGFAIGAASNAGGSREPSLKYRLKSSHAFIGLGIGSMSGFVLGHSRRKHRIAVVQDSSNTKLQEFSAPKSVIIIPTLILGSYGAFVGSAFTSIFEQNPSLSERIQGVASGGIIGGSIGAGIGGIIYAIIKSEKRRRHASRTKNE